MYERDCYYYSKLDKNSYKLSNLEIEGMIVDEIQEKSSIIDSSLRRPYVRLSNVYALDKLEKRYTEEGLAKGIYRPNMCLKMSAPNEGHIIVYNLSIFLRENGRLVIPEGVSVISCNTLIRCKSIKLPKSLSSIIKLRLQCEGTVNLKNVRLLSDCEIDAKKLVLPYTLERISSQGLTVYGSTKIVTERSPVGGPVITGSLGVNAIQDKRDKKTMIYLSNRFCNLYSNSLTSNVKMFREQDKLKYKYIKDIFIRDYYPHFLYPILNDTE